MRRESDRPEREVAVLAERQHGVVTFQQLLATGISASGVVRRLQAGWLHRLHRQVYAVGHRGLSNEGRWLAAVLAVGDDSALSHRSGSEHLGLLPPSMGDVDVSVSGGGGRRKRRGIRIHRLPSLTEADIVVRDEIRVTTPARTLRDLKRVVTASEHRRAVRQAEVLGYELGGVEVDGTRSELEYLFLRLIRRHHLPKPEVNARVGPFLVDFLWRRERLVVETDGWRYHRGAFAAADDEERDRQLRRWGYQVLRFTYVQVTRDPRCVAAAVRQALDGAQLPLSGNNAPFRG
jgi:very-short-patch-repair endonuclease